MLDQFPAHLAAELAEVHANMQEVEDLLQQCVAPAAAVAACQHASRSAPRATAARLIDVLRAMRDELARGAPIAEEEFVGSYNAKLRARRRS